ncbi:hypothetical protein QVD17_42123 [Tagetes erecta]|uniref:Uncharacterized protein n=1 Tax=Tagetes erecta TaxID=13708 RepID=A0AAD8NE31_TARER|nr:hypothetical protein QVD17_42123 [Tagetes erecta]
MHTNKGPSQKQRLNNETQHSPLLQLINQLQLQLHTHKLFSLFTIYIQSSSQINFKFTVFISLFDAY